MGELRVAVAEGSLHVEKDSSSFSHTFSEDPWTAMLEVELALRDWLGSDNVSGQVLLEGFTVSELDICCVQTRHMVSFGRHLGDGNITLRIGRAKRGWKGRRRGKSMSQHA
jgi:hypothetical protein